LRQWKSTPNLELLLPSHDTSCIFVIGLRVFLMAVCGPTEACVSYS
jgi:hypothetical protein